MKDKHPAPQALQANFPFTHDFLPLAMSLVDKGSAGLGYSRQEAGGLILAMEELFSFYARQAAPDSTLDIFMEDRGSCLDLTLSFHVTSPDLRALNLTWKCNLDNEESLDMLGPMLAARSVSSLRLDFGAQDQILLRLTKNRDYAPASTVALPPDNLVGPYTLVEPTKEDIYHFSAMCVTAGLPFVPDFLSRPGMVADMYAAGHVSALVLEQDSWIRGGVLWRPLTDSCLECYGPYLFGYDTDDQGLTMLLDAAVARISRSSYRGLVRRQGALPGFERFFDFLGELHLHENRSDLHTICYYRQLKEESSGTVYCPEPLASFLHEHYDRLCLPRQIRQPGTDTARLREASVLAVELEHARSLAILRPLCAGKDMAENITGHLDMLQGEGLQNFFMELNTGRSDDLAFVPALAQTGFVPHLIIPDAGQGDLVIYAHQAGA
ncbi:hypothetical protein MASR1M90_05170 [Desulfovibrionales bacterium]